MEKALGFCSFQAQVETASGIRPATVLIRGKMKGGKACPMRVEAGCFVLVDGDPSKILEVVGVVNRQEDLERLKRAGRVSKAMLNDADTLDELFDRSEEDGEGAVNEEAVKDEKKKEAQADALFRQYMEKRKKVHEPILGSMIDPLVAEEEESESGEWRPRRRRVVIAAAAAAATGPMAAAVTEDGIYEQPLAVARAVPDNWEDDIDIDAI